MKIIIPFKETSSRCPNKNFILFPYVMKWLIDQDVDGSDVYVVSNSSKVEEFVCNYNVNFTYEKLQKNPNDIVAASTVAEELGVDKYIELPLTQPVRDMELIQKVSRELQIGGCDFVTTYQVVTDRSLFYLDDNLKFVHQSRNRKGCMCPEVKMLDGAIYGIDMSFARKISQAEDINAAFWSGNFKAIENKVDFFVDVDTMEDMRKFQLLASSNAVQL